MELLRTQSFTAEPVMSDDGTDLLYMHYIIDCLCVFSPGATAVDQFGIQVPYSRDFPTYADTTLQQLKQRLSVNRQPLFYRGDNSSVISSPPIISGVQATIDCNNGPRVLGVSVTQVTGSRAFLVRWRGETWLSDCSDFLGQHFAVPPLVSNRWTSSHHIDENLRTTINMEGVAVFRSDILDYLGQTNNLSIGADYFRDQVIPPSPSGFKRVSTKVQVNPIGNILMWGITDQQQIINLGSLNDGSNPWGVTKFSGKYSQNTIPGAQGSPLTQVGFIQSIDITAQGHPTSSKKNLLVFLAQMASERLALPAPGGQVPNAGGLPIIVDMGVGESLEDRQMSIHVRVLVQPAPDANLQNVAFGRLNPGWLGIDFFSFLSQSEFTGLNPNPQYDNGTRGDYWGQAFTQAIQASCVTPLSPSGSACIEPARTDNFWIACQPIYDTPANIPTYQGLINQRNNSGIITGGGVQNGYKQNSMVAIGPVTAPILGYNSNGSPQFPNIPPEVMYLAVPVCMMESSFRSERVNAGPVVPNPVINNPNYRGLDTEIYLSDPGLMPSGADLVYHVEGAYQYVLLNNQSAGSTDLSMGANPAYDIPPASNPKLIYENGLIV